MLLRANGPLVAMAIAVTAYLGMFLAAPQAMGGGGSAPAANKYFGVKNVYWSGVQIGVWSMPGQGVHAYKVTSPPGYAGPVTLSEGWHFCVNQSGYAATLKDCMGLAADAQLTLSCTGPACRHTVTVIDSGNYEPVR
jgi:hypothetical protein